MRLSVPMQNLIDWMGAGWTLRYGRSGGDSGSPWITQPIDSRRVRTVKANTVRSLERHGLISEGSVDTSRGTPVWTYGLTAEGRKKVTQ